MQVGAGARPAKLRSLDLPFTAVEWVLPQEGPLAQVSVPSDWMVWQRSPNAGAALRLQDGTCQSTARGRS